MAMCPDAPYFIILLCLMPDDFTRQGESAATQWVNQTICPVPMHPSCYNPLSDNALRCALLYYFTMSNVHQTILLVRGRVLLLNGLFYIYWIFKILFFCSVVNYLIQILYITFLFFQNLHTV
jgi:hypothetical protein